MSRLSPTWFRPQTQPDPENVVEFHLRPLTMAVLLDVRATWRDSSPSGEGFALAMRSCVIGWKNIKENGALVEFSVRALDDIIEAPTLTETVWAHELVFDLLAKVTLTEAERKNS